MSILVNDEAERVVDRSPEFDQTAVSTAVNDYTRCESDLTVGGCRLEKGHAGSCVVPLAFVPPSQGKRIEQLQQLVRQQEGDLDEACQHIARQGVTLGNVRRDLLDLFHKARNGVQISAHDIANIIPDSPAEFKKAA